MTGAITAAGWGLLAGGALVLGAAVADAASLYAFIAEHGGRAVVKTPRGGYDGKGVRVVADAADAADWLDALEEGGALLAEELVSFSRELAQQVARRPSGDLIVYPVVETVQEGGVCAEAIAPGRSTTNALPTSPMRSSGTPITAATSIAGCAAISFSISAG